jgi:hypothetical protein
VHIAVEAELRAYREQAPAPPEADPLEWWAASDAFPLLRMAAVRYLSTPATLVQMDELLPKDDGAR